MEPRVGSCDSAIDDTCFRKSHGRDIFARRCRTRLRAGREWPGPFPCGDYYLTEAAEGQPLTYDILCLIDEDVAGTEN